MEKKMTFFEAYALGISAVIGAGIFVLPIILKNFLGSFSIYAWFIAGLIAIIASMFFFKVTKHNVTTLYDFSQKHRPGFWGFFTGYLFWLSAIISIAAVARVLATEVLNLFPLGETVGILLSAIFVVIFTFIVAMKKESGVLHQFFMLIKLALILAFISFGISGFHPSQLLNVQFPSLNNLGLAVLLAFWAFMGFEHVANLSSNIKDPKKNVPKAIFVVILTSFVLYVLVAIITNTVSFNGQTVTTIAEISTAFGGKSLFYAIEVAAIVSFIGVMLTSILGAYSLFSWLNKNKFVPKFISERSHFFNDGLFLQAILTILFIFIIKDFFSLLVLTALLNCLAYITYTIVFGYHEIKNKNFGGLAAAIIFFVLLSWLIFSAPLSSLIWLCALGIVGFLFYRRK